LNNKFNYFEKEIIIMPKGKPTSFADKLLALNSTRDHYSHHAWTIKGYPLNRAPTPMLMRAIRQENRARLNAHFTGTVNLYANLIKANHLAPKQALEALKKSKVLKMSNAVLIKTGRKPFTEEELKQALTNPHHTMLMYGSTKELLSKLDEHVTTRRKYDPYATLDAEEMIKEMNWHIDKLIQQKVLNPQDFIQLAEDMYAHGRQIKVRNWEFSINFAMALIIEKILREKAKK
jgi:hypothetical protein